MRATKIIPGPTWTKRSQKALLAPPVLSTLHKEEQIAERNRAFDLLDALSRSGGLTIESASLHVRIWTKYVCTLYGNDSLYLQWRPQ